MKMRASCKLIVRLPLTSILPALEPCFVFSGLNRLTVWANVARMFTCSFWWLQRRFDMVIVSVHGSSVDHRCSKNTVLMLSASTMASRSANMPVLRKRDVRFAPQFTRYTVNCVSHDVLSRVYSQIVYIIALHSSLNITTFCFFHVCLISYLTRDSLCHGLEAVCQMWERADVKEAKNTLLSALCRANTYTTWK